MPDSIDPQELLNLAWTAVLAPNLTYRFESGGQGQARFTADIAGPSSAGYRRAVSSAYYGLFHALTLTSASLFAPSVVERQEFTRLFRHSDLKNVTGWVVAGSPPEGLQHSVAVLREEQRVRTVSAAFFRLHKARETADYDHTAAFDEGDTHDLVRAAQEAVDLVQEPSFATGPAGRLFLGLVALRARGGGG